MSWPADGRPRFVTVETHGWRIHATSGAIGGNTARNVSYAVLDRAYCHGIVAEFASEGEHGGGKSAVLRARAQAKAEAVATERNAEHAADAA